MLRVNRGCYGYFRASSASQMLPSPCGSFPERRRTGEPIPDLVPDLAVEVLSESNTAAEMRIKTREYFKAGVRQVWLVDPKPRTVTVFESPGESVTLDQKENVDGGTMLPGFTLSLSELFAELDRHG